MPGAHDRCDDGFRLVSYRRPWRAHAVLLLISVYEKWLEDVDDLAVAAERRDEATIPHEQFVAAAGRPTLNFLMTRTSHPATSRVLAGGG